MTLLSTAQTQLHLHLELDQQLQLGSHCPPATARGKGGAVLIMDSAPRGGCGFILRLFFFLILFIFLYFFIFIYTNEI